MEQIIVVLGTFVPPVYRHIWESSVEHVLKSKSSLGKSSKSDDVDEADGVTDREPDARRSRISAGKRLARTVATELAQGISVGGITLAAGALDAVHGHDHDDREGPK
jgi:hypothetical protein